MKPQLDFHSLSHDRKIEFFWIKTKIIEWFEGLNLH